MALESGDLTIWQYGVELNGVAFTETLCEVPGRFAYAARTAGRPAYAGQPGASDGLAPRGRDTMAHRGRWLLVLIALIGGSPGLHGQGPVQPPFRLVPGMELGASVNLTDRNVKAAGTLFLATKTERARAVVVLMNYGPTEELMLTGSNPYSIWHAQCEEQGYGLLHLRVSPIQAPAPGSQNPNAEPQRNAAAGGAEALTVLLKMLAAESKHPELADAPLLFWGWSAAAGFGPSFARLHPERTIGFVRYHSHLRGIPVDMESAKDIPALLFVGAEDSPELEQDATELFRQARSLDAPWAFVRQLRVPHVIRDEDIRSANELVIPWIAAVVGERLDGAGPRLHPIARSTGWMGDLTTGDVSPVASYTASLTGSSWLPDERTAKAWQTIVRSGAERVR